jgi:hypothetical protein
VEAAAASGVRQLRVVPFSWPRGAFEAGCAGADRGGSGTSPGLQHRIACRRGGGRGRCPSHGRILRRSLSLSCFIRVKLISCHR